MTEHWFQALSVDLARIPQGTFVKYMLLPPCGCGAHILPIYSRSLYFECVLRIINTHLRILIGLQTKLKFEHHTPIDHHVEGSVSHLSKITPNVLCKANADNN
jgi:hypothetical protein